jgi:hypothetical protein
MLHNGNRINGHPRSEESVKLICEYLVKCHKDKDDNSLYVRFCELLQRIETLECNLESTWSCFMAAAEQHKKDKELKDA